MHVGDGARTRTAAMFSLKMRAYDSRGAFRVFEVSIDDREWRCWRDSPGFSQRFNGTFAEGGNTIGGCWQLSRDGTHWDDDLRITYRRRETTKPPADQ